MFCQQRRTFVGVRYGLFCQQRHTFVGVRCGICAVSKDKNDMVSEVGRSVKSALLFECNQTVRCGTCTLHNFGT